MPTARAALVAASVGGKIYAIGGNSGSGMSFPAVEEYDPVLNAWASRGNMPVATAGAAVAVLNDTVYVVGGARGENDQGDGPLVTAYRPVFDAWEEKQGDPIFDVRWKAGAAFAGGKLYVSGGQVGWAEGDASVSPSMEAARIITLTSAPASGELQIHNNIIRMNLGQKALLMLNSGGRAGHFFLRIFTQGGVLVHHMEGALDFGGKAMVQFDGRGNRGGWSNGLRTGMYWVVVGGAFKDRQPLVIVNE